jgi:glycosyltransferase involved in cell wall biosynthesis
VGLHAVNAIQAFRPHVGGAELQLERLAPHLTARGIGVEVVTRAVSGCPRRERIPGAAIHRTPLAGESPAASLAYVGFALARILRGRARIDLVHAHGALSPATIALGAQLAGIPCLVTVLGTGPHGDLARLARKPLGARRARLLFRRARFVALSADARDELVAHGVAAERIRTIPNGVDLADNRPATPQERARLRAQLGLADRGGLLGAFVGRLHPVKNVDTLLEATARVPELSLAVVGDGPDRGRLESESVRLGIADRVSFRGQTGRVADILRAADVFLLSSHGEGMSNALLEAMACGLPCLAGAAVGGARELLGEGRGLLVAGGETGAWADALRRVAGDPELRLALGDAAARFVAERLSLEAVADRLAAAYAEVAGAEA